MNTTDPLVSILVVAYNQEAFIGKALDSLLSQECPFNYEILVGEDCSTDQTRTICIDYAANYPNQIRLFLNKQNKGMIRNFYDLLNEAKGRYLADCGGDDYWMTTDRLSRQVAILEQYRDVTMVYGNWQKLNQKNNVVSPNQSGISENWYQPARYGKQAVIDYINQLDFPRVVLSSACYRKDLLMEVIQRHPDRFNHKDMVCEDLSIIFNLLALGPFFLMKDELIVYRVLEESVSHQKDKHEYLKGFAWPVFIQTIKLALELDVSGKDIKPYVDKTFPDFVLQAFISGDKEWMGIIRETSRKLNLPFRWKQNILFVCLQNKLLETLSRYLYQLTMHSTNQKQSGR